MTNSQWWTSFLKIQVCKTSGFILKATKELYNRISWQWKETNILGCSKNRQSCYRTSNSILACVGDKCMFAPMNLSICPSVIPPWKPWSLTTQMVLKQQLTDKYTTEPQDKHYWKHADDYCCWICLVDNWPWVASIQHHGGGMIHHSRLEPLQQIEYS